MTAAFFWCFLLLLLCITKSKALVGWPHTTCTTRPSPHPCRSSRTNRQLSARAILTATNSYAHGNHNFSARVLAEQKAKHASYLFTVHGLTNRSKGHTNLAIILMSTYDHWWMS
jgi:hypothetical protein